MARGIPGIFRGQRIARASVACLRPPQIAPYRRTMGVAAMNSASTVFPAPAKLNLFLHVVGRRQDGYHLLQTAFRFIDYGDELSFAVRADGEIRHTNPLPGVAPENDLSVRAARALQEEADCRQGADISIVKRLPMGGGLGGGSSDAATTLIALNRLWGTRLPRARLQQLAWYLILVPELAVSTTEIFSAVELTRNTNAITIAAFSVGQGRNDLEPVVCRRYPLVARHLEWLYRYGDARMTGSGACVFCAFENEDQARRALSELPAGMHGFVARGLDRHPLWLEDD